MSGLSVRDVWRRSDPHQRHRHDDCAESDFEVGPDLSRFKSAKHFTSWLGLCRERRFPGQSPLRANKRTANRAAQALRMAAAALRSSQSALGAYYRRLCARLDRPKAITATAHKLARLIYTMLTKERNIRTRGQDYYEERYRQRVMHHLAKRAENSASNSPPGRDHLEPSKLSIGWDVFLPERGVPGSGPSIR